MMREIVVWTVIFVMGMIPVASAQQDVIGNLKVVSIKTIQIRPEENTIFMDMEVAIENSNSMTIRLRNGDFDFFIGSKYTKPEYRKNPPPDCEGVIIREDKVKKIGTAKKRGKSNDIELVTGEGNPNIVKFRVDVGKSRPQAFEAISHMLNCIGYREFKYPLINIGGKFELGVRSDRGWSMVESVKIEWNFCPETQKKVDFFPGMSCPQ